MRVLGLNRCAALREVGFNIEEDGVVAKITGYMSIRATLCSDSDSLLLEINSLMDIFWTVRLHALWWLTTKQATLCWLEHVEARG
jgi:hypothetical protein